jgi:hypothetical protein
MTRGCLIQSYVDHYKTVRLHSAIGYVTPQDMFLAVVILNDTVSGYTEFFFSSFTGTGSDTLTIEAQTNPSEWYVDDVVVIVLLG